MTLEQLADEVRRIYSLSRSQAIRIEQLEQELEEAREAIEATKDYWALFPARLESMQQVIEAENRAKAALEKLEAAKGEKP